MFAFNKACHAEAKESCTSTSTVGSEEGKPEAKLREKQFLRKSTDDAGAQAIVRGGRSW